MINTMNRGIGETIYYNKEVDDLRRFIASQEWSLNKYKSISHHLCIQIINHDKIVTHNRYASDEELVNG